MSKSFTRAVVHTQDVKEDHYRSSTYEDQIVTDFLEAEDLLELTKEHIVISVEVNTEEHHEDRYHPLDICGVGSEAVVLYAEASRTGRTEGEGGCLE